MSARSNSETCPTVVVFKLHGYTRLDFVMFTQKRLDGFDKGRLQVRSDYALAKRWGVSASEVSQYRRERLRLPLAVILDIAEVMRCDDGNHCGT